MYSILVSCTTEDGMSILPGEALAPDPSSAAPSADTSSEAVFSCPSSLLPRLSVGLPGRVTPGDANNIRTEPGGTTVIGQIPAGEQFDVLDGPVCSPSGLTFWQVQYGELTGRTAEGQETEYWLEPVQSGRG